MPGPTARKSLPGGKKLSTTASRMHFRKGRSIAVPNAGAGSSRSVFKILGYETTEPMDTTSSAGDWTFAIYEAREGYWYLAVQSNRHPHHGFQYSLVDNVSPFETLRELQEAFNSR